MQYLDVANGQIMFLLCLVPIVLVMLMAVIFMITAWREGIREGIEKEEMKKIIVSSAVFSIVPSIAVLLMLVAMTQMLGKYFSWLRLSVIGSGIYETMAANMALMSIGIKDFEQAALQDFTTVMLVMTAGILVGPVMNILFLKKYDLAFKGKGKKQNLFVPILIDSMFIGILVEWLAPGVLDFQNPLGIIAMTGGFFGMLLCIWIESRPGGKKMESFSMSIAMIIGMASAIIGEQIIR